MIEHDFTNLKYASQVEATSGEGRVNLKVLVIAVFVIILADGFASVLMAHAGTPVDLKIAWLQYPNDWNADEPDARIDLLASTLKPSDWNIQWDTINLDTSPKEEFLQYDLIVMTGHSAYALTTGDNDKLEFFANNGGTLWIDSCGSDFQLNNFFLSVQFTPEVTYQGQDILQPGHRLLDGVYTLSQAEVDALGEGSTGQSSLILEGYDTSYLGIIRERATGKMLTLEAKYGSGLVVVTAQDILCALQAGESEDLKFSYNIIASAAPTVPLSVSISPVTSSVILGESVAFSSTAVGGITPYGYQWYLDGNPVSGATSAAWTFEPTSTGICYVYVNVTDSANSTAQSETARITVASVPVGGYSFQIEGHASAKPLTPYLSFITVLAICFVVIRRKTARDTK